LPSLKKYDIIPYNNLYFKKEGVILTNYENYQQYVTENIKECLNRMGCLPILFIGSGFSKHYFGGYNWEELLKKLAEVNPLARDYAYYKQNYGDSIKIGSKLSEEYMNWAWGDGKTEFDDYMFSENYNRDIFIKSKAVEIIEEITPTDVKQIDKELIDELELLKEIKPHAIITTNYDRFTEVVFSDYTPIIGQKILRNEYSTIGEIYKIHGCVTDPSSIVLTEEDYIEFMNKKKYLSAKLLTFFLEHPIIVIGYSASDPNIQAILSDIDEIISSNNELIPNIFFVDWQETINQNEKYPSETIIRLENQRGLRINNIVTNSFDWIFEALINENALENIDPKLLRALLARTYQLVRTDIPKKVLEIDYSTLESALQDDKEIGKIFGITSRVDSRIVNIEYPYTLSDIATLLGYPSWNFADNLISIIKRDKGYNIKGSDNKYHIGIRTGKSSFNRKYSKELFELLNKVRTKKEYEILE